MSWFRLAIVSIPIALNKTLYHTELIVHFFVHSFNTLQQIRSHSRNDFDGV